jgi:hypothetical protein
VWQVLRGFRVAAPVARSPEFPVRSIDKCRLGAADSRLRAAHHRISEVTGSPGKSKKSLPFLVLFLKPFTS